MFLDLLTPGDTSLYLSGPLISGFGVFADPPNELKPVFIEAFSALCSLAPTTTLRIDFSRGEGMRKDQIMQRLETLQRDGLARQTEPDEWFAEWADAAGPLDLLRWVHGCEYEHMWGFGDLALTDSDGRALAIAGPRSQLEGVLDVFRRACEESGLRFVNF
jgi:hypothetical protein